MLSNRYLITKITNKTWNTQTQYPTLSERDWAHTVQYNILSVIKSWTEKATAIYSCVYLKQRASNQILSIKIKLSLLQRTVSGLCSVEDMEWTAAIDECLTVRFYWDEVQNNRHLFVSDSKKCNFQIVL